MDPWSGRPLDTGGETVSPDDLVVAELVRATTSFAAAIEIAESGFGRQGAMLSRSLFEGMAIAHWIHANADEACATFERAHRFERHLTAGLVDTLGWTDEVPADVLESARLDTVDLRAAQGEFGEFGARLWTGRGLHALVCAIEDQWTEGHNRDQLWQYWRVVHRDNNQMLHSSVSALVGTVVGEDRTGRTHQIGASEDHVEESLWAAHWCYSNIFTLATDRFGLAEKDAYSAMLQRHQSDFLLDSPLWDEAERNDPCPCESGEKFKRCHQDAVVERRRVFAAKRART